MTFLVLFLMAMGKKINLSDRLILKEALNHDNFGEIVVLIKRIFKYTLILELIGTIFLSSVFIPEYGTSKGIFYSVFHSISAFCNAGIDILGDNSFINYSNNIVINFTLMFLIIIGGLGFTVWTDITGVIKKHLRDDVPYRKLLRELTLHTKIVLTMTLILLMTGTLFIYVFEYNNIATMGNDSVQEKLLKSVFQSTTLRTAGFSTINLKEMTTASKLISMCYMFIGGSPGSTAGGIKNVTMLIVTLLIINYMKDREKINIFKRNISENVVRRAVVVFVLSILVIIIATMALLLSETLIQDQLLLSDLVSGYTVSFADVIFEVVAAFSTAGLPLGFTSNLTFLGKIIIIVLMIIGRLRTSNNINGIIKKE